LIGQKHDRIVRAEGIVDDPPIRAVSYEIRADEAAQRHERDAFFARFERRVQRRAGCVFHADRARGDGGGEARRLAELAEAHGRGFDGLDATCADQHVGLQARGRQGDQMESSDAATDQGARRRHGDARQCARHHHHRGVDERRECLVERLCNHRHGGSPCLRRTSQAPNDIVSLA